MHTGRATVWFLDLQIMSLSMFFFELHSPAFLFSFINNSSGIFGANLYPFLPIYLKWFPFNLRKKAFFFFFFQWVCLSFPSPHSFSLIFFFSLSPPFFLLLLSLSLYLFLLSQTCFLIDLIWPLNPDSKILASKIIIPSDRGLGEIHPQTFPGCEEKYFFQYLPSYIT